MTLRQGLEERLRGAGYRDRADGIFEAATSRRSVALIDVSPEPALWPDRLEGVLRRDSLRLVPSWSRYVLLLVDAGKTPVLASAAAAFCRDVSKCRRLVAFADQTPQDVLPFLGLSPVLGGGGTPVHDVEGIARKILGANELSAAFLDAHVSLAHVQKLAEETEE
jgi:hypothetical protein